jgi:protein TonB
MSAAAVSFRAPVIAWAIAFDDEARFKRILRRVVGAAALACLVFSLMPRPHEDRAKPEELPPRLAKLVLEREPLQMPKKAPEPQNLAKADIPVPKQEAVKQPLVPEARQPQPNKPPGEIENARRKASAVGLLAMKDQLAELRGAPVAVQLKQDIKPGPGVGSGVGPGVGAGSEAGLPARALITSNLTGGSGGINTASYSRNTGGGGLAGRSTTLVEGVAGGGGGGGAGGGGARGAAGGVLTKSGSGKASRSIEEIKLVFERNKGAIYAIYNRALREEPSLQGKVVVELKIAPGGEVVGCRVLSTELKTPELEQKLLARIRQFDFGAKDVDVMVVSWPVDFLPS